MVRNSICVVTLSLFTGVACAQSSVTLYGIIDVGVNYVNNDGGKSNVTLTSGVVNGSRWGLKGVEDLGGGLKANFQLENGFSVANGTLGQGGRLFGRQAWVGMSSERFGSVTAGRQLDSVVDYLQSFSTDGYTGVAHPFDNDNLDNGYRVNNTVKYTSPKIQGFQFGGMYGFSNSANTGPGTGFGNNRQWGLGADYQAGVVGLGAAYSHLNYPNSNTVGAIVTDYPSYGPKSALGPNGLVGAVTRQDILGGAASVTLSAVKVAFVYTKTRLDSASDRLDFSNYELNFNSFITPYISITGGYIFTDGKLRSKDARPRYHQVELMGDYFVSKRTDVYLLGIYQRAAGDATVASIAPDTFGAGGAAAPDASTTKNQVFVRLGLRHRF